MQDVAGHGRTVLFVSHNMTAVRNLCTRGVLLSSGKIKSIGAASDVISHYEEIYLETENRLKFQHPHPDREKTQITTVHLTVDNSTISKVPGNRIDSFSKLSVDFELNVTEKRPGVTIGFYLYRNDEHLFTSFDTDQNPDLLNQIRTGAFRLHVNLPSPLKAGHYHMDVFVGYLNGSPVDFHEKALVFQVEELSFDPAFHSMSEKRRGVIPVLNKWQQV